MSYPIRYTPVPALTDTHAATSAAATADIKASEPEAEVGSPTAPAGTARHVGTHAPGQAELERQLAGAGGPGAAFAAFAQNHATVQQKCRLALVALDHMKQKIKLENEETMMVSKCSAREADPGELLAQLKVCRAEVAQLRPKEEHWKQRQCAQGQWQQEQARVVAVAVDVLRSFPAMGSLQPLKGGGSNVE